ncbi:bifunctional 6-phosphofructo-2-kinase/fructose-2,6-bisphosphate 2-phosphatase [Basidiobolus meristosporus CBS 931.73]|uniref:Bifunctional 6-phosphofructo-2-kinase/fructose-2,6-bisphosphate 2-phosphatase n=1 Tax=Basidiobolus meristosporus CBS 931.73 TaxID=1314790 RepID=A0A1Y1XYI0_9FUNG|nr:bifunctional 6-phosphofructo-2-kinase/fructose-2,6-bisphosphate 2-phosphatase [Basidiobolus meristosporus CBS 931.73]|eukprot:ORX90782.1 bifunctional 6-phosphofructo-2-kinase/fructose-2,6-bisphosphate 2-phosphatase [Basidiobolus meristosporus CBS 931.73]
MTFGPNSWTPVPGAFIQKVGKDVHAYKNEIGPKAVVVMVGLPARGKSYIVKKLKRYLSWLGFKTMVFNVGNRRRTCAVETEIKTGCKQNHTSDFFSPNNSDAKTLRDQLAMDTLNEVIAWLNDGGKVGILDATNSTKERRQRIIDRCARESDINILFVESICTDPKVLERNMQLKLSGPDYRDQDSEAALADFQARVTNYEKAYETIDDEEDEDIQYCKIINVGKKVIAHNIQTFLAGQCVFYLMNMNLAERQIWLTRHGESLDNQGGKIGGDSPLSPEGHEYAEALAAFMAEKQRSFRCSESNVQPQLTIWTSMLRRAVETAENFDPEEFDIKHMKFLNEIYAGVCEGMTYKEIQEKFPDEFKARSASKFYYRYPGMGGESYCDVIQRLSPVIVELERTRNSVLIITHRAIMRSLLAYFMDIPLRQMTNLEIPLNTLYCIEAKPYGNVLCKYEYSLDAKTFLQVENTI